MSPRDPKQGKEPGSNLEKDPDEWTTRDEPRTEAQASYLRTLSEEAGEPFDPDMTKAEASKKIDELRERNPRVRHPAASRTPKGGAGSNTHRSPEEWATSGEPMTEAQASYLRTLSEDAGEPFDPDMTKAEASKKIDELRERNPRVKRPVASRTPKGDARSNIQRSPEEWATSGEPMTEAQASYLKTLSEETGEPFDPQMTKGEASKKIDELRQRDPRLAKGKKPSR